MRAMSSVQDDRLAEAGPAEQAGLAAADERREQVDDLDAGLEQFGLRRQFVELRRLAVDGRASPWSSTGPRPSIGSPSRLNTRPSVSMPTGTRHRAAGVDRVHAADEAVGGAEGDAADAAAAEVLLHLAGQVDVDARPRSCRRS